MPNVGPIELIIVLVVALLILGPKRLPAAGRGLGEGIRGFKDTLTQAKPDKIELASPPVADPADRILEAAGSTAGAKPVER